MIERVRTICTSLEGVTEKLSRGEPTFLVNKRVFVMFANSHHNDGRVAIWIPAPIGVQESLVKHDAETFFRPHYVGVKGWVGIVLNRVDDKTLNSHVRTAYDLIVTPKLRFMAREHALALPQGNVSWLVG